MDVSLEDEWSNSLEREQGGGDGGDYVGDRTVNAGDLKPSDTENLNTLTCLIMQ